MLSIEESRKNWLMLLKLCLMNIFLKFATLCMHSQKLHLTNTSKTQRNLNEGNIPPISYQEPKH